MTQPARDSEPPENRRDEVLSDSTIAGRVPISRARDRRTASLIVVQGAEIGREYRLQRSEAILGRDPAALLRVMDDGASRQHARVVVLRGPDDAPVVVLQDLGSTNGTWVNGQRIEQAALAEGDKVQLGDTVLKFVLQDELDARFHEEVRYRIAYDQLTGLLQKESLFLALDAELRRAQRYSLPLSILMMDLDRFKSVNDTHGHLTGSFVLQETGRLLTDRLRRTDVAARYGGEEFVAYLSELTATEALVVAERIRSALEDHRFRREMESGQELAIQVTISIGVAEFPAHGGSRESLIAAADAALYRAKSEGRNRVCLADAPPGPNPG